VPPRDSGLLARATTCCSGPTTLSCHHHP
jgi:hypothetical protein